MWAKYTPYQKRKKKLVQLREKFKDSIKQRNNSQ